MSGTLCDHAGFSSASTRVYHYGAGDSGCGCLLFRVELLQKIRHRGSPAVRRSWFKCRGPDLGAEPPGHSSACRTWIRSRCGRWRIGSRSEQKLGAIVAGVAVPRASRSQSNRSGPAVVDGRRVDHALTEWNGSPGVSVPIPGAAALRVKPTSPRSFVKLSRGRLTSKLMGALSSPPWRCPNV
jgi:hypothetical protein